MEERRRDGGSLAAASSSSGTPTRPPETAAPEPTSSRRRAGGQKRKANNNNASGAFSAPSKRLAREKPPPAVLQPPIHNGPCTRARQTPNNLSAAAGMAGAGLADQMKPPEGSAGEIAAAAAGKEAKVVSVDWEALESAVDAEFEAVRSRDANAQAVPIFCGWFSWTKIHPLEERLLPTFFNGKSESRTPEIYMEMRNWIMKKYHADPNTQIELKDLSELSVGDLEAKQEVMEFLDYWGLINFHPFPPAAPAGTEPAGNGEEKMDSSLEKLYCFESVKPCLPVVPKTSALTPVVPSGWFPEAATAEELARAEGPSVEYHCNSCSADCSRKRYHCQKQADFDLCTECYNNGKFDSDMASSDFILMEPAEVPGLSSGKWTDQETLLLLEALELFHENWNEIAEHVATKTKAQCILHFVQMPIEDTFLDCESEINANIQETADLVSANNDSSIPKEDPETTNSKANAAEDQHSSTPMEISKSEDNGEVKGGLETDKKEANESCALKALKEAFEAVGSFPVDGGHFSFAEAGNPVMALAAFLVKLVEHDVATASARCSLKSLSGGLHLAARHCFLLEDPPDDKKQETSSERAVAEIIDKDAQKDKNQEERPISVLDGTDSLSQDKDKEMKDYVPGEKEPNGDCTDKSPAKEESVATDEEVRPVINNESKQSNFPKDQLPNTTTEVDDIISKPEPSESPAKESVDFISKSETSTSPVKELGDKDYVHETSQCREDLQKDTSQQGKASKELDMVPGPHGLEKKEPRQQVTSNLEIENGANSGEDETKDPKNKNWDCAETMDDRNIDKLKHAAMTALSAAAVKANLLASHEEDQIRQLAVSLIEKQLYKLETKLAFFNNMDSVITRVKEQLDRSRQKLYHERAQIIAARFGYQASVSKPMPQPLPSNRIAMNHANSMPRPAFNMASQRPSIARPFMTPAFNPSNPFVSPVVGGNSSQPSGQDKFSSLGMK